MNITAIDTPIEHQMVDFIVVPHFENTDKLNGSANKLDTLLNQSISKLIADEELNGGGLHEIKKGGLLKVHTDFNKHPSNNFDRRINVLIYLKWQHYR